MEQTYKISESDISATSEVEDAVNQQFIDSVMLRFKAMGEDWYSNF